MNDIVPISQTVLIALAVGLGSGTLAGCLNIAIDRFLLKKNWRGWSAVLRDISLQAAIYGLLMGVGALIFATINPYGPEEAIDPFNLYMCLAYGVLSPIGDLIVKLDWNLTPKANK